jgi:glycerol-3-phosphate cytidylyltransferase
MSKILTIDQISVTIEQLKATDKSIILVGGCFDILHPGHIHFLSSAKNIGGIVLVLLESDQRIRNLKGESRPVHTQSDRAIILSALSDVDYVIPLPYFTNDDEYKNIVTTINPDYFAITKNDPVQKYVDTYASSIGATVMSVTDRVEKHSTTDLVNQLNI